MSEIHKTAASLRFFGANVDPDEITALLGHPPTVGARANGVWHTHNGTPKTARRGFWRREVERVSPGDLDGQIDQRGFGSKYPVGDNKTYEGRQINDRIEVTILQLF